MILDVGRICLKIAGREGGKYCVVVGKVDANTVMVSGPKTITGVKRRKCNITHLEPTMHVLEIGKGDDASVEAAWKTSKLVKELGIEVPKKSRARESKPKPKKTRKKPVKKKEKKKGKSK